MAPAIEYLGKDTYFRNVYTFLDRINDIIIILRPKKVRGNL